MSKQEKQEGLFEFLKKGEPSKINENKDPEIEQLLDSINFKKPTKLCFYVTRELYDKLTKK